MNKAELVAAIADRTGLSKKDAEAALKAFTDVVAEELKKGEKIQLVGFGTFEVSERAERVGRNPQTGAEMKIPASKARLSALCVFIGENMRLDKFLKVSRLIKRRTIANEACDAGRVMLNGKVAKASVNVKPGDILEIAFGSKTVKAEVLSIAETVKKEEAKEMFRYL